MNPLRLTPIALASLFFLSQPASAVTMTIGDVDGFGFVSPNSYSNAQGGAPDTNSNGLIGVGEYLPDLDGDGRVHYLQTQTPRGSDSDHFDNRSPIEAGSTNGAQYTDMSLGNVSGDNIADSAIFTFNFAAPVAGDSDYGVNHYVNLVFGDYDVNPATLDVDGVEVALVTQGAGEDGLVQLAYAEVPWEDIVDGEVVIDVNAPNEPYLAIDFAYLSTEAGVIPEELPEPSMLALLGAGLLGFSVMRRRKTENA